MNYEEMGQRIRKFRKALGLTQEKLAELADISSIYMSQIETAHAKPSLPVMIRIAYILKVPIDEIVYDVPPFSADREKDKVIKIIDESSPYERDILVKNMESLKALLDEHFK